MRLYLSSYKCGNKPEQMFKLLRDEQPLVAVIANSADLFPEEGTASRVQEDIDFFRVNGLQAERFDLRDYFDKQSNLEADFSKFGLVWLRGANVFVLRRAMNQSGFDELIKKRLAEDSITYAGFSAGSCVLSPSLKGFELVDDANTVPEGYDEEVIWDGLGILPYAFIPHFKSDHPESADVDRVIKTLQELNVPYRAFHDGEAIVIDGAKEMVVA